MRQYFIRLLDYDRHANLLMLDALQAMGAPEKTRAWMAHLLAAQQVWIRRCKKLPAPAGSLWPDWKAETFKQLIEDNHAEWVAYLKTLEEKDFQEKIVSVNSKGETYHDQRSDVLAHMINHGTHHRAQIGQHLKAAGLEKLPVTDFIFYVRSLGE